MITCFLICISADTQMYPNDWWLELNLPKLVFVSHQIQNEDVDDNLFLDLYHSRYINVSKWLAMRIKLAFVFVSHQMQNEDDDDNLFLDHNRNINVSKRLVKRISCLRSCITSRLRALQICHPDNEGNATEHYHTLEEILIMLSHMRRKNIIAD